MISPLKAGHSLSEILEAKDPAGTAKSLLDGQAKTVPLANVKLLAPIDRQEVWAAGVTYKRSKAARMEESVSAATFYDKVYEAARPELFFKANAHRAVGPGDSVRIRRDGQWNVPEPELTLVLNSRMELVGFTIGNDMSCRDIEGENPLYLPQAKTYDQSCSLGPAITLAAAMPPREQIGIRMTIARAGSPAYEGSTSIAQMARTFEDLIGYLGRDNTFRDGVYLLTGTGIVPDSSFTLRAGDQITIAIDGIGQLVNTVVQG
jgi:2-dehydro-3-deoxy-D-arabinonate dehydratase